MTGSAVRVVRLSTIAVGLWGTLTAVSVFGFLAQRALKCREAAR